MTRYPLLSVPFALLLLTCGNCLADEDANIYGTWQLLDIGGTPPPSTMTYIFEKDGELRIETVFEDDPKPIVVNATYTADGKTLKIKMPAEVGGDVQVSKYRIDGKSLTFVMERVDGEKIKFTMQRVDTPSDRLDSTR